MKRARRKQRTFVGMGHSCLMPFGLMNSQATFQSMMDRILLKVGNVRCYVDDVVIFSKNTEEHASHLEDVFAIMKNN